jgi:hypothetical protein
MVGGDGTVGGVKMEVHCWECEAATTAGYKAAPGKKYCEERLLSIYCTPRKQKKRKV